MIYLLSIMYTVTQIINFENIHQHRRESKIKCQSNKSAIVEMEWNCLDIKWFTIWTNKLWIAAQQEKHRVGRKHGEFFNFNNQLSTAASFVFLSSFFLNFMKHFVSNWERLLTFQQVSCQQIHTIIIPNIYR